MQRHVIVLDDTSDEEDNPLFPPEGGQAQAQAPGPAAHLAQPDPAPAMQTQKRVRSPAAAARKKRASSSTGFMTSSSGCTSCGKADAEYRHPELLVGVCGRCLKRHKDKEYSISHVTETHGNTTECLWCGSGDDAALLMCDTCKHSICEPCVTRNFGSEEMLRVRDLDWWRCFKCDPTPAFKRLQLPQDHTFFNMEDLFAQVQAPKRQDMQSLVSHRLPQQLIQSLSEGERRLASLFCGDFEPGFIIVNLLIADQYLLAQDLCALLCLSKNLRLVFSRYMLFLPGLFKTKYPDDEPAPQLFQHQYDSLRRLIEIETRVDDFGALRGGIFADAPGLGKTVTVMALIVNSAGTLPKEPTLPFSELQAEEQWHYMDMDYRHLIARQSLYDAIKSCVHLLVMPPELENLKPLFRAGKFPTIKSFISYVKERIRRYALGHPVQEATLLHAFRRSVMSMKEGMDKKQRAMRHSDASLRLMTEVKLVPSSATLIVVPMSLLEHWYEQISRHVNLAYLVHKIQKRAAAANNQDNNNRDDDDDFITGGAGGADASAERAQSYYAQHLDDATHQGLRNVVYFDGLGDIVDIKPPVSKINLSDSSVLRDPYELAQYLIVVTTLERCAAEFRKSNSLSDVRRGYFKFGQDTLQKSLQHVRWLRLIVDEGHELGQATSKMGMAAVHYINELAAERRWVMSGTPTTGHSSQEGLLQVQRLLSFLRHPRWGVDEDGQQAMYLWQSEVVVPFICRNDAAKASLVELLRSLVIRHQKSDIELDAPIRSTVTLEPRVYKEKRKTLLRASDEGSLNVLDEVKADFIFDLIREQRKAWLQRRIDPFTNKETRRPKVIVFADDNDTAHFNGVASYLYAWMGDAAICEHGTKSTSARARKFLLEARSSEISRFRTSKRKTRQCPLCGFENPITAESVCQNTLFCVEYNSSPEGWGEDDVGPVEGNVQPNTLMEENMQRQIDEKSRDCPNPQAAPAGHAFEGRGGHFFGRCLCSPQGCDSKTVCLGYPNPFDDQETRARPRWGNLAIVRDSDFEGFSVGSHLNYMIQGRRVFVVPRAATRASPSAPASAPAGACADAEEPGLALVDNANGEAEAAGGAWGGGEATEAESGGPSPNLNPSSPEPGSGRGCGGSARPHTPKQPFKAARKEFRQAQRAQAGGPLLWRDGVLGGLARVRFWKTCGRMGGSTGFHRGLDILDEQPWVTAEEEASVLLLQEDGHTGLDLSFATHIVLLNQVSDGAIEEQIVSRAYRMGAKGPVRVILLLANEDEDEGEGAASAGAGAGRGVDGPKVGNDDDVIIIH